MQQKGCACAHANVVHVEKKADNEAPQQPIIIDSAKVAQIAKSIRLRDDPVDWNLILYFILGTIGFYALSGPVSYFFAMDLFPNTDTGSNYFKDLYYRLYVNTTYVSFGIFLFFIVMYCIGFAFVEVVNLQNYRGDPFMSRDGSYKDIKQQVWMAAILFGVAGMVTLRQKMDLSEYCKPPTPINGTYSIFNPYSKPFTVESGFPYMNHTALELSETPIHHLFASIDRMDYLNTKRAATPDCHEYSTWEVFKYNYFIWVLAFFVGLQFTHLDNGILQQLTLDWNIMKNWPMILWVIFIGLLLLFATIIIYIFYLYYSIGYLSAYITLLTTVVSAFSFLVYWYNLLGYTLHVHHWFLGFFMQIFMCYQNGWISAIQAIFGGIMTEGASRWGYDPLFNAPSSLTEKQALAMTKHAQSQARLKNHEISEHRAAAFASMGNISAAPLITQVAQPVVYHQQPAQVINYQYVEHPESVEVHSSSVHAQPVMMYPGQHPVLVMPPVAEHAATGTIAKAASQMA